MVVAIVVGAALGVSQARVSEHHAARPNSPHFMRVRRGAVRDVAATPSGPASRPGRRPEPGDLLQPGVSGARDRACAATGGRSGAAQDQGEAPKKTRAAGSWSARPAFRRPRPSPASPRPAPARRFLGPDDGARGLAGVHLEEVPDAAGRSRRRRLVHRQRHGQEGEVDRVATGRFPRTRSARSPSTRTTRPARRSTSAPASRTARATPRPASACTSRPTAARPGRASRQRRRRRALRGQPVVADLSGRDRPLDRRDRRRSRPTRSTSSSAPTSPGTARRR